MKRKVSAAVHKQMLSLGFVMTGSGVYTYQVEGRQSFVVCLPYDITVNLLPIALFNKGYFDGIETGRKDAKQQIKQALGL